MMRESLENFAQQFATELEVGNAEEWQRYSRFVVAGMGGSALAASLLALFRPEIDCVIHRDYGLPHLAGEQWQGRLVIISSFSGNTEEAISAFEEARARHLPIAVIAGGGKLLEAAKEGDIPFVQIPAMDIRPRVAVGSSFLGLCKLIGDEELYEKARQLAFSLRTQEIEEQAKKLAGELAGTIPVIYGSENSFPVAYQWKILLNETARMPAFAAMFPELNHNEMAGFDMTDRTRELGLKFHPIFIRTKDDYARTRKRMDVTKQLFEERGLRVTEVSLDDPQSPLAVFSCILLAHFTALLLGEAQGSLSEKDEMIEEFKKRIH